MVFASFENPKLPNEEVNKEFFFLFETTNSERDVRGKGGKKSVNRNKTASQKRGQRR